MLLYIYDFLLKFHMIFLEFLIFPLFFGISYVCWSIPDSSLVMSIRSDVDSSNGFMVNDMNEISCVGVNDGGKRWDEGREGGGKGWRILQRGRYLV